MEGFDRDSRIGLGTELAEGTRRFPERALLDGHSVSGIPAGAHQTPSQPGSRHPAECEHKTESRPPNVKLEEIARLHHGGVRGLPAVAHHVWVSDRLELWQTPGACPVAETNLASTALECVAGTQLGCEPYRRNRLTDRRKSLIHLCLSGHALIDRKVK